MHLYNALCKYCEAETIHKLIHCANVSFMGHKIDEIHVYHVRRADGHVVTDSSGSIEIRIRLVTVFGSVNSEHSGFCLVRCQYASICGIIGP